jgi:hypothetical protein
MVGVVAASVVDMNNDDAAQKAHRPNNFILINPSLLQ